MLGLSNCYEVTGGGVLALAEHATGLRRLELYNCEVLDEHLEGFSRVSSAPRVHSISTTRGAGQAVLRAATERASLAG